MNFSCCKFFYLAFYLFLLRFFLHFHLLNSRLLYMIKKNGGRKKTMIKCGQRNYRIPLWNVFLLSLRRTARWKKKKALIFFSLHSVLLANGADVTEKNEIDKKQKQKRRQKKRKKQKRKKNFSFSFLFFCCL